MPATDRAAACSRDVQERKSKYRKQRKITVDVKSAMRYNITKGKDERYGKNRNCQEY